MRRVVVGLLCGLVAGIGATAGGAGPVPRTTERLHRVAVPAKVAKLELRLGSRANRLVKVEILSRRPHAARRLVTRAGGRVQSVYGGVIEARVPATSLPGLAKSSAVSVVRAPARPVPDAVRGEGVTTTGAAAWHRAGVHGEGVRVAIVDLGFLNYRRSQSQGDLPPKVVKVNYCGTDFESTDHGTAVAEIVSEIAPAADLYLVCVRDVAGLGRAVEYARTHGIAIISHSASWFNTSRGDGLGAAGTPEGVVAAAHAAGILWVNAAGNRAQQHWSGTFVDANANGWNEFAPGDEGNTVVIPAGSYACAALKWDDWPGSAEDYDLYFTLPNGAVSNSSRNPQTGTEPPTELVCQVNDSGSPRTFGIAIRAQRVTGKPVRFDLFTFPGPNLEYQVAAGSVTEPGTSPAALTVGAACWRDNTLEPYSSQGPTIDSRAKPDLVGPDSVSSGIFGAFTTCGRSGFAGTSAATPHVAAAAALVKQANPSFGPDEIAAYLEERTVDLGAPGRDAMFGSGALSMGAAPRVALGACVVPSLVGRRLAKAKTAIRKAGCALGRVRSVRFHKRAGKVVSQSPKRGTRLVARGRVSFAVGR
ncbi:MAG TPA: S8 family serine peptidase [Gaiellaceae bacterium]